MTTKNEKLTAKKEERKELRAIAFDRCSDAEEAYDAMMLIAVKYEKELAEFRKADRHFKLLEEDSVKAHGALIDIHQEIDDDYVDAFFALEY